MSVDKKDYDKRIASSVHKHFQELTRDVGCILRRRRGDESLQKITIIKPSSKEEVVMIFSRTGQMKRFFYKAPDSHIRMVYDSKKQQYVSLPNHAKIKMAYALVNNVFQPIGPSKHQKQPEQNFFTCFGPEPLGSSFLIHDAIFEIHLDDNKCLDTKISRYAKSANVVRVYDAQEELSEKNRILKSGKKIICNQKLHQIHSR